MLDFIWHFRGSVPLGPSSSDMAVLERVAAALRRQRKPISRRGPDFITFDSPLFSDFFTPNWLELVIYDRGRVWIEKTAGGRRLRYDLRSLHGFVLCLAAAFVAAVMGLAGSDPTEGLKMGAIAFGWLYGMNIFLAAVRVPGVFQRAVNNT
jgi:hypothetical protein